MARKTTQREAKKKKLPVALAKNVAAEVALKRARLAAEGREDIGLIQRRRRRIAEDFFDVGAALLRLKRPGVAQALGHRSFAVMLEAELDMSATKAERLIAIAERVSRRDATRLGQERATALLSLADATPDDDTAKILAGRAILLPTGETFDVGKAKTPEILDAAKAVRAKYAKPRARGRTTTPEERAHAADLERRAHGAGFKEARVEAVATRPGQPANARVTRVPLASFEAFAAALAKGPRGRARR